MTKLEKTIEMVKVMGWEWEVFESANNTMCLQTWPWEREMCEWEFSMDGKEQIGEEKIIVAF